ncbi:MAG TPA: hypothetical protein VML50_11275 [Anaeromyxobacter sp.]|nr:hypothetical protein [Anaeromyxobacter sp.]
MLRLPSLPLAGLALAALAAATPVRAEEAGAGTLYPAEAFPTGDLVRRPLTLAAGLLQLDLPLAVAPNGGPTAGTWFLPASLDYGITPDLQAGLYQQVGPCLSGEAGGCASGYDDLGLRTRYGLFRAPASQLVAQASVLASHFDRLQWEGSLGLAYKHTLGRVALVGQLDLGIALDRRSERLYGELLVGTLECQVRVAERLGASLAAGTAGALGVRSPYSIPPAFPLEAGLEWSPLHAVGLGAQVAIPDLARSAALWQLRLLVRIYL